MPATSRWTLFDANQTTSFTGETDEPVSGTGAPAYRLGSTVSGLVTILGGVSDQIQVNVNGGGLVQVTLPSGTDLDARTVAKDWETQLKAFGGHPELDRVRVTYENNRFRVYSSSLGTSTDVTIAAGANDARTALGMLAPSLVPGQAEAIASYTGQVTLGGQYTGQFSDMYTVMIGTTHPIGTTTPSGTNTYSGTVQSAGDWNEATLETYTFTINTANGSVMNNGAGNVPSVSWNSNLGDAGGPVELLYSNYWYNIGSKGLRTRFVTDAPFGNGDLFQVTCTPIAFAVGASGSSPAGIAHYVWSSQNEGKSSSSTVTSTVGTQVGTKGLSIAWSNNGSHLTAKDEFRIIASGPQPTTLGVTVLNYGAVTVSTYSPTKVVWFELVSGATVLSSPRFGLQSRGTAQHHQAGNNDTKFAFGNAGDGTPASDGTSWKTGVDGSTDLASDVPPAYLAATEDNLSVVSTASASEVIGVAPGTMVTDFIYLAVKLGAVETGSNPSIVYRLFFDFA